MNKGHCSGRGRGNKKRDDSRKSLTDDAGVAPSSLLTIPTRKANNARENHTSQHVEDLDNCKH